MVRKLARLCKFVSRKLTVTRTKQSLFAGVSDPRKGGTLWAADKALSIAAVALCCGKKSVRDVERFSEHDVNHKVVTLPKGRDKLSDNTLSGLLSSLDHKEMQDALWKHVAEMRADKSLSHDRLVLKTAALDGKVSHRGCTPMSQFAQAYTVKRKDEDGNEFRETRYKLHNLRFVTTSAKERPCFWQEPVPADTNEQGATIPCLAKVFARDKGKHLFELLTFDAGFFSHEITRFICANQRHWLSVLKENQPELFMSAQRLLKPTLRSVPEYTSPKMKDHQFYKQYRIWRTGEMKGWVTSTHIWEQLDQVFCVELIRYRRVGKARANNAQLVEADRTVRYFATSLPGDDLTAQQCLDLILSHWAIEDDCFNALDKTFEEDKDNHWTRGEGAFCWSTLLLIAYNTGQLYRHRKGTVAWDGKWHWRTWDETFSTFFRAFTTYYPTYVMRSENMPVI